MVNTAPPPGWLPTPIVPVDPASAHTEVGQLGSSLNRMLDRIASALSARHASETRVRQFVADASHELRTPLAAIRGYTELAQRKRDDLPADVAHAMNRVESETTRMTQLVEDMLRAQWTVRQAIGQLPVLPPQ